MLGCFVILSVGAYYLLLVRSYSLLCVRISIFCKVNELIFDEQCVNYFMLQLHDRMWERMCPSTLAWLWPSSCSLWWLHWSYDCWRRKIAITACTRWRILVSTWQSCCFELPWISCKKLHPSISPEQEPNSPFPSSDCVQISARNKSITRDLGIFYVFFELFSHGRSSSWNFSRITLPILTLNISQRSLMWSTEHIRKTSFFRWASGRLCAEQTASTWLRQCEQPPPPVVKLSAHRLIGFAKVIVFF